MWSNVVNRLHYWFMINLAHNMYKHFLKVRSSHKSQARKGNAYLSLRSKFYRNFAEAYFRLLHDAESFTVLLRGDQFVFQSINVLDVIMRPSTNETVDVLMEKVCESIHQRKLTLLLHSMKIIDYYLCPVIKFNLQVSQSIIWMK